MFRYLSLFCFTISLCYCSDVYNSTKFSLDLYQNLFDQHKNTIVSPYSLRVLLSILYQTAHGSSEAELSEKVHLGDKHDTLQVQKASIAHTFASPSVKLANKVFLKNDVILNKSFNNIVTDYKSAVEQVDFTRNIEAAQTMNSWVEAKTNGLIKNLVESDAIEADTVLFLINTIYFKANWAEPFSKRSVYKRDFYDINNEVHKIDMMSQFGEYKMGSVSEFKSSVLELEYTKDSNFVFWAILPDESSSLSEVKSLLTPEMITLVDHRIQKESSIVVLPLFDIEQSLDCKDILIKMGLHAIFEGEIQMLENGKPLKVDKIQQKSKIIVDTDGTEAASGTYLSVYPITIWPEFRARRPFIYMILTADTKEPIFIGHYSKV